MAIPIRHSDPTHTIAGARTFFVTSSIAGKRNLLQSDCSAGLFVRVLYDYREQGKFRLHEFVVMPDHFHVLLTVEYDSTIEHAVQFIKGGFAFRAGRELGCQYGRRDSQRCGLSMRMRSSESESTFGIIRLLGIWFVRQQSFPIRRLTQD